MNIIQCNDRTHPLKENLTGLLLEPVTRELQKNGFLDVIEKLLQKIHF